jgi:hypothetical protein
MLHLVLHLHEVLLLELGKLLGRLQDSCVRGVRCETRCCAKTQRARAYQLESQASLKGAAMTPHSWNIHKISIEDLGNLFETWCLLQFFSCYFYWLIFHVERPARP